MGCIIKSLAKINYGNTTQALGSLGIHSHHLIFVGLCGLSVNGKYYNVTMENINIWLLLTQSLLIVL